MLGTVVRRCALTATAVALFTGCALLTGCSGGSGTPATNASGAPATTASGAPATTGSDRGTGPADTCALLSLDQVSAALGEPAAAGKPEPMFDTPECEWDPASGHNGTVTLDVGPWEGDPGIKPLKSGTPVPGVGDEAYDSGNAGLFVRKGSRGLRIWVFNVNGQSSRLDLEKQLATTVLAKL
jgi:hypothetical protein